MQISLQCVKSKSVTNLAEAAADPAPVEGNSLPFLPLTHHHHHILPTTEGPNGPVLVGHTVELIGLPPAPVIDVEAIEAGLELEEGAVGGGEVVTTSRTVQSNDTVSDDP